jgi:hypothetical protein
MFPRSTAFLCGVLAAVFVSGCAGYRVGTRSLYHPEIRTIYVPVFQSDSYRRNLGERLTEAVAKRIEMNTSYKVVHDPMADSQLIGRLEVDRKRVATLRKTGEPRDTEVKITARIDWTDRRGNLLRQGYSVVVPGVVANVSATSDVIPEAGSSIASTHQQTIDRLADEIVSQLEIPW